MSADANAETLAFAVLRRDELRHARARYRAALVHCFDEGLTVAEIAAALDTNPLYIEASHASYLEAQRQVST
jgi:hypothetical protein